MKQGLIAATIAVLAGCSRPAAEQAKFETPPGFRVERAAAVGAVSTFTFDSLGRPVVAKERGHATIFLDKDGDGVFESEQAFSSEVSAIRGMWFDGRALYALGRNSESQTGLYKLTDNDGDDRADAFEQLSVFEGESGDRGPIGIRRDPGGAPTILFGNRAKPQSERMEQGRAFQGGMLVRWNQDRRSFTALFGGLGGGSGHAYNADGEAFVADPAEFENANLPWYRGARLMHGVPGGDYGWRDGAAMHPSHYPDTLPAVEEPGRQVPTSFEFYRHNVYPREYFDVCFRSEWAGAIHAAHLTRRGATYAVGRSNTFVRADGFNITGLEVGPDSFLYFSSQHGLHRVRYTPSLWTRLFGSSTPGQALELTRQPQPLSSWGHAKLERLKESMGPRWGEDLEKLARDPAHDPADRVQALHLLQRFGPAPALDLLRSLANDRAPSVRAAAMYVAGLQASPRFKAVVAAGFRDTDPSVRRRAAEAFVQMGLPPEEPDFVPIDDAWALLRDRDRFVRYAGRLAVERFAPSEWRQRVFAEQNSDAAVEGVLALIRSGSASGESREAVYERILAMMATPGHGTLRLFQLAASYPENLSASLRKQVSDAVIAKFPSGDEPLDREMARVLALCGQPEAIAKILAAMPRGDENQPLQIHYADCLRSIKEGWTPDQRASLTQWSARASKWTGGANFARYLKDLLVAVPN